MTELLTRSGAWLLQQAPTLPDTFVMKTVAAERGWFETVTGLASGLISLTLLVFTIFAAPAAWEFWKTYRKMRAVLDRVYADINPITHHAARIADNIDYITTSIRNDVQQVNATIASANRRLNQAVKVTETRLNEFNALLQVVQQEAEQAFVSTASVVHGVRTGAATFSAPDELDGTGDEAYGDDDESDGRGEAPGDEPGRDERGAGSAAGASGGGGRAERARDAAPRPRLRSRRHRE